MKEELKNIFLMGLGAMSMTNDKAQEEKKRITTKRGRNVGKRKSSQRRIET